MSLSQTVGFKAEAVDEERKKEFDVRARLKK